MALLASVIQVFYTLTDFLFTFFYHLLKEEWQNIQLRLWIYLFFLFSPVNFCYACFVALLLDISHLELCLAESSTLSLWNDSHFLCNTPVSFGRFLYLEFAWHIFSILFSIYLHFKDWNIISHLIKLGLAFFYPDWQPTPFNGNV